MTPALDLLRSELTAACTTPNGRLVVSVPPQEGLKTSLVRELCVDLLKRDPDRRLMYVCYSQRLAVKIGREVRLEFDTPVPSTDGDGNGNWDFADRRGGIVVKGVGAALLGWVFDVIVVDDPIRYIATAPEQQKERELLHPWWDESLMGHLVPGGSVVAVQTRMHTDDLAGRLIAQGWPSLNIPALADGVAPDALQRPVGTWLESLRGRTEREWKDLRLEIDERSFTTMWQGCP